MGVSHPVSFDPPTWILSQHGAVFVFAWHLSHQFLIYFQSIIKKNDGTPRHRLIFEYPIAQWPCFTQKPRCHYKCAFALIIFLSSRSFSHFAPDTDPPISPNWYFMENHNHNQNPNALIPYNRAPLACFAIQHHHQRVYIDMEPILSSPKDETHGNCDCSVHDCNCCS